MRRRVVITGMGALTPLGHSVASMFEAQLAGRSGVGPMTRFNARSFPTTFAAEVRDFDLGRFIPDAERFAFCGVNTQFAVAAARQALDDSGLFDFPSLDPTRCGIYLGSGEGIQDFYNLISHVARAYRSDTSNVDFAVFERGALKAFHAGHEAEQELHTTAGHLGSYFGLEGPNYNCLTACAASSQAVGEAVNQIRHGDADVMLSGGSHSMIHPLGVTGFIRLTALSTRNDAPTRASRPFDLHRDGFVLGEGSGMLILEELEHARRRGARIYAELTGYGTTADAYRVTDSHPEGRGATACMTQAIREARLEPGDIDYINAHGTSTKVNDLCETVAIKKVFGEGAYQVPISSSKSMMGHLIGAGGAVELITCIEAIRRSAPTAHDQL